MPWGRQSRSRARGSRPYPAALGPPVPDLRRLPLPLETGRLRLEFPSSGHLHELVGLLGDPQVSRWLLRVPFPYTRGEARAFLRRSKEGLRSNTTLNLWVVERSTGRLVGGVGLRDLNPTHHSGEIGYWIGRPFWGRGYATEATSELVELCLGLMHLHRLEACIFRGNGRSARVLKKLGFRREGVRRKAFLVQGRWVDDVLFGLLPPKRRRRTARR